MNQLITKTALLFFLFLCTALNARDIDIILEKFNAGKASFEKKEYSTALSTLATFVQLNPFEYETREAYFLMAESARHLEKWHEALRYYNIIESRYPYMKERRTIIFRQGICYYQIGNTARAVYQFKEYLKGGSQLPFYLHTHVYLAEIYEKNREWDKAVEKYLFTLRQPGVEATLSKKTIAILHERLGYLYSGRLNKPALAYHHFQMAIANGAAKTPKLRLTLQSLTLQRFDQGKNFSDLSISDIKVDGDDIYIGTFTGGLYRFVRSKEKLERISLPSVQVRGIYIDFDKVYIATFDGIFIHDKKSSKTTRLNTDTNNFNLAQKVIKDDRYLYFSTLTTGVIKFDTIKKTTEILSNDSFLKTNQVYDIDADHRYLVFGTINHGAVVVRKSDNKIIYLSRQTGDLHDNNVKAVKLDGRFLWLGVHGKGVYRYDLENASMKFMNWNIPFPSVIARREREIWIGTTGSGIRIFDREKEEISRITPIDGLRSNEIQHIEIENDYVWLGYLDAGIDIFYNPLR